MVLHNPNNWHWVNKDASAWARTYFDRHLTELSARGADGSSVKVDKVLSVDGDVDVSQRKGKVITLFDVKIQMEFSGKTHSQTDVGGTITIPEAVHDTELDEYVFEISIYSETKEKETVKDLIRSELIPQLRKAVHAFADELIEEHGKDIQHTKETDPKYNFGTSTASSMVDTSKTHSGRASPAIKSSTSMNGGKAASNINTTALNETYDFQTTAAQLYATFVEPQRIAAFTRAAPQEFVPKVGGTFKLFNGNVEGEFVELSEPNQIIQKWRLAAWPQGHFSNMKMVFDQGYNSTTLRLTWSELPVSEEDAAKRNFEEYYIRSIKLTFGFGAIL